MSAMIHPTAIISDKAKLGSNVEVGPYCVIDENVSIGSGCILKSHVVISGHTNIGENNRFFPFSSIGQPPQDLKFGGETSEIIIGDDNTFREYVTVNPGTKDGGLLTKIGSHCMFMASSHVAHDCYLGDSVIMANSAALGGHVEVGNGAIIGGLSGIHQFSKIGRMAMVAGLSGVNRDVPPFCLVAGGFRPHVASLNLIGLKRAGFSRDTISILKRLLPLLFRSGSGNGERLEKAKELAKGISEAEELVQFVLDSDRGVLRLDD
ncbi:MAG: acyl-ACP--UDP-N-acetylglucosamine O-acyltransferase [Mariprofundaceae bacterium]